MKYQFSKVQAITLPILLLVVFCLKAELVSAQTLQAELVKREQSNPPNYERYLLIKQVDSTGKTHLIDSTEILSFVLDYEFSLQGQYLYVYSALSGEFFSPSITKIKVENNRITLVKRVGLESLNQRHCMCDFYSPGVATLQCNNKKVIIDLSDLTISAIIPYKTE